MPDLVPTHAKELALIEAASRALAEARSVEDVKVVRDKAEAIRAYYRQQKGCFEAQQDAAELKLRAERRLGELLAETVNHNGSRGVGSTMEPTIPEGISKKQSHRWQRIASLDGEEFERHIQETRAVRDELTTAGVLRLAKKSAKPEPGPLANGDGCTVDDLQKLVGAGRTFGTIYADPPWKYGNQATRASTDNHYVTMTVEEIAALPVPALAADRCHLHLWTTNAFLRDAFNLLDAWGFQYKSVFVWCKRQMGIGNYWRVSHEFLLLGVKGDLVFADHALKSYAVIDRGRHSAKPEEVRVMIERASPGPYLELFGRQAVEEHPDRPGWAVWGNEVGRGLFAQNLEAI